MHPVYSTPSPKPSPDLTSPIFPASPSLHPSSKPLLLPILESTSELNSDAGTEITETLSPYKLPSTISTFKNKSFNERLKLMNLAEGSMNPAITKTCSLSPMRELQKRFSADFAEKKKFSLPAEGNQVLYVWPHLLTEIEKKEIGKYSEVYYIGEYIKKIQGKTQDEEGAYRANVGDHLGFRYEILQVLGRGSFGKVFKCLDHKRELQVAVKVLNNTPRMKILGENEINILQKVSDSDPDDSKCLIKILQCFEFRNHICIVSELLSTSLYRFIRNGKYQGLELNLVKRVALQILVALKHLHSLGIIHRDIKLENILFKHENKSSIKLIDLGSATSFPSPYYSYIQSRYYRAPEVMLGCGYTNKIDLWSFGCVIIELLTGRSLFVGKNQKDQLLKIATVLGPPPSSLLEKGKSNTSIFNKNHQSSQFIEFSLKEYLNTEDEVLIDFVRKCLQWDPEIRTSAEDALKHPWINSRTLANSKAKASELCL